MKPQIVFDDFAKLDLRVGEIVEASEVVGSEKLVRMLVNFGEEIGHRTIFAGIKAWYTPDSLTGRKAAFVVNLAPKTFKIGKEELVSEGMLMAAGGAEGATLYIFDKDLTPGTILR